MSQTSKAKTFSRQHELPRLPVPTLEHTLNLYLQSLRPLATPEELEHQKALADDFEKTIGPQLQQHLIDTDRASPYNWLDDNFWIKKAYHEWREPLCVNSNWYFLCKDDPNHPKELLEENGGVRHKGEFGDFQVKRAAKIISNLIDYKDLVDSEQIPIDTLRNGKLQCMFQYSRIFGITRIPQPHCDTLVHTPHPTTARHIIVLVCDQIYSLDVYEESGVRVPESEIEFRLNAILSHFKAASRLAPIPLLTASHRDHWTAARQHLLTLSPVNRATLTTIEDALFAVSLDDYAVGSAPEACGKNIFVGDRGKNRWFDKSITLVVESNGKVGINGEHSPCDALIPAFMIEEVLSHPTTSHLNPNNLKTTHHSKYTPKKLEWVTDEKIQQYIFEAGKEVEKIVNDSDLVVFTWNEYGTDFVKKIAKFAPDAYFQMVLQLTYYHLHHSLTATYETGSTRQYLHGRTETTRTLSSESAAFVQGWADDSSLSANDKYALLKAAVDQHVRYQTLVSKGWGCDRHLLGLRVLNATQPGTEMHALFRQPIFSRSLDFRLSTSSLHDGKGILGTGFGAVTPDGYGINYMPSPDLVRYGIESKRSSKHTVATKQFVECLKDVLGEMAAVCKEVDGSDKSKEAKL